MSGDLPYSPGLDRTYSSALSRYVRSLSEGESVYWTLTGWSKTGPGIEFVKDASGFLRPARRRTE